MTEHNTIDTPDNETYRLFTPSGLTSLSPGTLPVHFLFATPTAELQETLAATGKHQDSKSQSTDAITDKHTQTQTPKHTRRPKNAYIRNIHREIKTMMNKKTKSKKQKKQKSEKRKHILLLYSSFFNLRVARATQIKLPGPARDPLNNSPQVPGRHVQKNKNKETGRLFTRGCPLAHRVPMPYTVSTSTCASSKNQSSSPLLGMHENRGVSF